jgi:hypothetical protein
MEGGCGGWGCESGVRWYGCEEYGVRCGGCGCENYGVGWCEVWVVFFVSCVKLCVERHEQCKCNLLEYGNRCVVCCP